MLGAGDGEPRSYLEIADAIRRHGAAPKADLRTIWMRIVFNILISNTDDHLRNHGFLYESRNGWRLSPAYDLNPVPTDVKPRILTTAIDESDGTASLELALSVAAYFELDRTEASRIAAGIARAVEGWRMDAEALGIPSKEISRMRSALEHRDREAARHLD